jgi:hypothetical protein
VIKVKVPRENYQAYSYEYDQHFPGVAETTDIICSSDIHFQESCELFFRIRIAAMNT